jgi:hypothetical protein
MAITSKYNVNLYLAENRIVGLIQVKHLKAELLQQP